MGKKIDAYFLTILTAICFYLYFYQATQSRTLSIPAALLCCVLTVKTFKRILKSISNSKRLRKRRYCKQAKSVVMELACAEPEKTSARLKALFEKTFHEEFAMELIQAYPDEKLTPNAIFKYWKKHRNEEKLLICATCACEADVRIMASSLRAPRVAVMDAEQLKRLMAENPADFPIPEAKWKFNGKLIRQRLIGMLLNRRNAPRCALFGLSSLLMYIFSGNVCYLFSAMLLFASTLFSLRHAPGTSKLF